MKYATISDLKFAIAVLVMSSNKVPEDSFAKIKVTTSTNRVVFELQDMIKELELEEELSKSKDRDFVDRYMGGRRE